MSTDPVVRTYRFSPRDRAGWLLGLQGGQCLALGVGVVAAGVALNAGAPGIAVALPLLAGAMFAFAPVGGGAVHEIAPVALSFGLARARGRLHWEAPLPLVSGEDDRRRSPALPPAFGSLRLRSVEARALGRGRLAGLGVVVDDEAGSVAGVLRVRGREFALVERGEQDRLVALWGEALAAFCMERGPVVRVAWSEWAAPAGLEAQLAHVHANATAKPDSPALSSYLELLEGAGPMATRHEVLVTVTVGFTRLRGRHRGSDAVADACQVLAEELRLLAGRLEVAGLSVEPPLSAAELAVALRFRLDPACAPLLARRSASLAEAVEAASIYNAGPLSLRTGWSSVAADGGHHVGYWVAEWPRLEMPAAWLEPVLLHAGATRTVSVLYEPVPPSRSQRQIDRDATRLAADEEQRSRGGFRVGARHRRAQAAVAERESELVAGYAELAFVGLVVVTASNSEALERACAEYEQVAASAGLELRRLDGRHDLALAASLPLGRGVGTRWLS